MGMVRVLVADFFLRARLGCDAPIMFCASEMLMLESAAPGVVVWLNPAAATAADVVMDWGGNVGA